MNKRNLLIITKMGSAISNAKSVESISAILSTYGYTRERLDEGWLIYENARSNDAKQQNEKGLQKGAIQSAQEAKADINVLYMEHLELARLCLSKDTVAYIALQLGGTRKKSKSGNVSEMTVFYINLLAHAEWLDAMAHFGVSQQKLEETQKMLHQIDMAYSHQAMEDGAASNATKLRNEAVDAAKQWYSTFCKVARIAMKDNPSMLEMLGIKPVKRHK